MSIELLLALSAITNRVIEYIKPLLHDIPIPERWRQALVVLVSAIVGVVLALLFDLNLFVDSVERLQGLVGVVATGILIGLGSNAIHAFAEVINLIRRQAPAAPTTSSVTVSTTTSNPSPSETPAVAVGTDITVIPAVPTLPPDNQG